MRSTVLILPFLFAAGLRAADDYTLGPDSSRQEGVPQGTVEKFRHVSTGRIFPGTERDWWVYVPKQYDAAKPACLMVFQDGGGYQSADGQWRVPVVFDNLIHRGEMPVTIGVFVNPGEVPEANSNALRRYNRSYEYDGLGDGYARFLVEELLPEVEKKWNISENPDDRAIGGASSGAIAAFTAAWERPDAFRRVFSTIGTYVGLRGGDVYHTLVRKSEPRPLRLYLQDGSSDLNIYGGDWWIANQQMLSAFEFAGYEVNHAWGDGGHNGKHGGSIFPDAMRWLWKDHGKPIAVPSGDRHPVSKVLIPGEDWKLVGGGYIYTDGLCTAPDGSVYFADAHESIIYREGPEGRVREFAVKTGGVSGLSFSTDGRLLAAAGGSMIAGADVTKQILAYDTGKPADPGIFVPGAGAKDLCTDAKGNVWWSDFAGGLIWHLSPDGKKKIVAEEELSSPTGIALSPDQTLLYAVETTGQYVWSWQIAEDGSLRYGQRYFHLHLNDGRIGSGGSGMCVDSEGRLYVCTHAGIQFCDQAGRVNGILRKPSGDSVTNIRFGGPELDTLYATCGSTVWKRKVRTRGVRSTAAPVKPEKPRL